MPTIYVGSITQAHGRAVIWQDTCRCDVCQAVEFRCAQCGGFTEYTWMQCPHQAPTPRVSLAVAGDDGGVIHLTHARRTSIQDRPADNGHRL